MPGVVIRGGFSGQPDLAKFSKRGIVTNSYLDHDGLSSAEMGYWTSAPGFIAGIICRASENVASDVE